MLDQGSEHAASNSAEGEAGRGGAGAGAGKQAAKPLNGILQAQQ